MESRRHVLRKATVVGYKNTINQLLSFFSQDCLSRKIASEKAEEFISTRRVIHPCHQRRRSELSAWGRNAHLRHAHAMFAKAVEWEYIKKNPFERAERAKPVHRPWHFLTFPEFRALLAIVPELRIRCLYDVMYGTGLRIAEAINLLWDGRNVDFERGRINVTNRPPTAELPGFRVKDHEMRSLPMPNWLQTMLVDWQAQAPEGCPFVFLEAARWQTVQANWRRLFQADKADEWQNRQFVNNLLRNYRVHCRRAEISTDEKLTLHCLRKSYAQNLADAETPAPTLKKLMGHSSIRTTEEFYLRSSDANEERACLALEKLMSEKQTDVKMTFSPLQRSPQTSPKK